MGKIELDHTGSGSGITLSSDGTDLLLDGTAIGGGGGAALELYAENPVSAVTPIATGNNSISIGSNSQAASTNGNSIAIGTTARATGNSSAAFGGNFPNASAAGSLALGYTPTASGAFSAAIGYDAKAVGDSSVAFTKSYAGGTSSFAAAIANNTSSYGATGANSIAMGYQAKATGLYGVAIGYTAITTGSYSVSLGGTASASRTAALGQGGIASHDDAVSLGYGRSNFEGHVTYTTGFDGGKAQLGMVVLRSETSDATPKALTVANQAASTDNQIILPDNSAFAFHGTIVARQQASGGTASAAWKIEGLIRREGSAGTTVLVNSATTVLDNTPGWGLALSADTTNGGLAITVTGAAATNIRWVATIHTSEVTYA